MAVWGIDISTGGGTVDFGQARDAGVEFVIIKTGDGLGEQFANKDAGRFAREARQAGLRVGFYHYNRPRRLREGAVPAEAEWMKALVDRAGGLKPGDLRVAIDVEEDDGPDQVDIAKFVTELRREVATRFGHDPMLYCGWDYSERHLAKAVVLSEMTLWVASWPRPALRRKDAEGQFPRKAPACFKRVSMWQYDGDVVNAVAGVPKCDVNIAQSLDGLLIGVSHETRVPPKRKKEDMLIYSALGSIWLLHAGKSHRFHIPSDVTALERAGVPNAGELSEAFHNLFVHVG